MKMLYSLATMVNLKHGYQSNHEEVSIKVHITSRRKLMNSHYQIDSNNSTFSLSSLSSFNFKYHISHHHNIHRTPDRPKTNQINQEK